ncbi:glycosyltransferase family 4 protein, partial [Elusimicrobiota bacterium]
MRIALEEAMHGWGKGGVSIYTKNLLRELCRLSPEDEFLLFGYFFRDYERKRGVLSSPPDSPYGFMVPRWPESVIRRLEWDVGLPCIGSYLKWKGVDLYHPSRIPRRKLLKTVVTIHDLFPVVHPEYTSDWLIDMWDNILKPGMRRVDKIIAISEYTKGDIVKHWNVPEERITVIHYGLDHGLFHEVGPERRAEVRERYRLPERFLLMIGPFDPWCDPANVIRAFARLPQALADVAIVFAGSPGSLGPDIKRLGTELGLSERLLWPGHVSQGELVGFYNLADALVYPSFIEGFGFPIIEGMACGAPVITSKAAAMPEVAGGAGILVD